MQYKGIIFDLDGTLVDSLDAHFKSWIQAFHEFKFNVSSEKLKQEFGKTSHDIIKSLCPKLGEDIIEKITQRRNELFQTQFIYKVRPFESVIPLLESLTNFKLIVASSNDKKTLNKILNVTKLKNYITDIVSHEEVQYGKPHPQIHQKAAQKLGIDPKLCIGVGDTIYDIISAKKAGMFSVAVASGEQTVDYLKSANPDIVISDIGQIKDVLNLENTC